MKRLDILMEAQYVPSEVRAEFLHYIGCSFSFVLKQRTVAVDLWP